MNNNAKNKIIGNSGPVEKDNELNNLIDMETLLTDLKNEDIRNLKMMRNFKILYIFMIIVYSLLMVVNPDPDLQIYDRISGMCYVISFTLFAFLFRKYHRQFGSIDYSLPSSEMFSKAAERYSLTLKKYAAVIVPILLIDAGLTISHYNRWLSMEPLNRILVTQAFFIPIIIIAGIAGYLIWRKRQKPLHDGARNIISELNEK